MKSTAFQYKIRSLLLLFISASFTFIGGSNEVSDSNMLIIPLKNAGRLYMIEAVIDAEKGNLILDTGASGLVLNKTYFRKYIIKGTNAPGGITGGAGISEKITIGNINISGLNLKQVSAQLSDLSHIENKCGSKILGLLGFDLIKSYEIVIDLNNNELQLYRINNNGSRISTSAGIFEGDHKQNFETAGNIVFLHGSIGGKILKFCLDTGAETNVIDIQNPRKVLETISVSSRKSLSGAGSARKEVLYGRMNDFMIGDKEIKDMTAIITSLETLSEAYGTSINGMLGYDFLKRGPVCINFIKKEFEMKILKKELL